MPVLCPKCELEIAVGQMFAAVRNPADGSYDAQHDHCITAGSEHATQRLFQMNPARIWVLTSGPRPEAAEVKA